MTVACSRCGTEVTPAPGYLGGDVMCNDCTADLVAENTI